MEKYLRDIKDFFDKSKNPVIKSIDTKIGLFGRIIWVITLVIFSQVIKTNLYVILRIFFVSFEPEFFNAKLITFASWIFAGFIAGMFMYILFDFFTKQTLDIDLNDLPRFRVRQKNCKTWLVGILVGLFSPALFGLIFAIRHRDLRLFFYPIGIYVSVFLITPIYREIGFNNDRYIMILQLICGLSAYLVARKNKLSLRNSEN